MIHPRQQQYILSVVGLYPTSKYSYNLIYKFCYTHYQTCLSVLTFIDKAYQCSPPLSAINYTHSQTCLSMLTSIDKAYQRLPPLSIISGWRLPRNPSTSRYRNRHNPSTSWHRNRPENIIFPFIPSSIPCFCQRLHIPPPPLCAIKQSKKRKKKSSSPSLKRDSENVYLCFSRSTRFRGWIGYDCSITVILHVCSCSCFSTKKRGLKKRKNHYYRPCINESSFVHSLLLMWFVVFFANIPWNILSIR